MRRSLNELIGFSIAASDGEVGTVDDFYFDDHYWTVRYLVVRTGNWLVGRRVLLSTVALDPPNWMENSLPVRLTREKVRNSPEVDLEKPVSRQKEIDLHQYYGWSPYWDGFGTPQGSLAYLRAAAEKEERERRLSDPHLRSAREVTHYAVQARDETAGALEDLIFDDQTWAIQYLVVDIGNWLAGRQVLLTPQWVKDIAWELGRVKVDLSRETIENSPEYDPETPVQEDPQIR